MYSAADRGSPLGPSRRHIDYLDDLLLVLTSYQQDPFGSQRDIAGTTLSAGAFSPRQLESVQDRGWIDGSVKEIDLYCAANAQCYNITFFD